MNRIVRRGAAAAQLALAVALALAAGPWACAPTERIRKQPAADVTQPPPGGYLKKSKPYAINGVTYYPIADAYGYDETGVASWYGHPFHGRPAASGEIYDMNQVSAAHKTLPLGSVVEVTRLDNGAQVVARVNDRGPFVADRIIDLSRAAAQKLDMVGAGTARVRVVALAQGRQAPGEAAPQIVGPPPDFNHGRFWVQVGAFGAAGAAERVLGQLGQSSGSVRLQPVETAEGARLTRVQLGPFGEMAAANGALEEARRKGFKSSFIVAD